MYLRRPGRPCPASHLVGLGLERHSQHTDPLGLRIRAGSGRACPLRPLTHRRRAGPAPRPSGLVGGGRPRDVRGYPASGWGRANERRCHDLLPGRSGGPAQSLAVPDCQRPGRRVRAPLTGQGSSAGRRDLVVSGSRARPTRPHEGHPARATPREPRESCRGPRGPPPPAPSHLPGPASPPEGSVLPPSGRRPPSALRRLGATEGPDDGPPSRGTHIAAPRAGGCHAGHLLQI